MSGWQSIETVPRDGSEVLLGFAGTANMDFYRWYGENACDPTLIRDIEIDGWVDRASDPPHTRPTHWMRIGPPHSCG